MSFSTLTNLIQLCVFALLGLSSLVGALFFGAWWHLFTAAGCLVFCMSCIWMMIMGLKA